MLGFVHPTKWDLWAQVWRDPMPTPSADRSTEESEDLPYIPDEEETLP